MEKKEITSQIIAAAIQVHKELGPGLLESAYQVCLYQELLSKGVRVQKEVQLPVRYKGQLLDAHYKIDLLVENEVIVELKSVESLLPIHLAQTLSYLRLADLNVALLINFNVVLLKDGVQRVVNNL